LTGFVRRLVAVDRFRPEAGRVTGFRPEVIVHWGEPERGGDFGAWEQPELFISEVRAVAEALGIGGQGP